MAEILHSSFLEGGSWRLADPAAPSVAAALGLRDVQAVASSPYAHTFVMSVSVERANDPSALLDLPWAQRQQAIQELMAADTLWTTYGGKTTDYAAVRATLATHGKVLTAADGYVDNDTRTIWVQLSANGFKAAFGQELMTGTRSDGTQVFYWEGNLSSDGVGAPVAALHSNFMQQPAPPVSLGGGAVKTLSPGPQSIGNTATGTTDRFPNEIAAGYGFPQDRLGGAKTGTVGIVAATSGAEVEYSDIQTLVDAFRGAAGTSGNGKVTAGSVGHGSATSDGERSLDVGIVSTVVPNSDIVLYSGGGSAFRATQAGVWDTQNNVPVLSVSYSYRDQPTAASPFHRGYEEVAVDAALRNVTFLHSSGDGGSGEDYGNGVPMVSIGSSSAYTLVVGGTSLTTAGGAATDATLSGSGGLLERALAHELDTLSILMAGGLKRMPVAVSDDGALVETVWSGYNFNPLSGTIGYQRNLSSGGGVDATRPQPNYQTDYALRIVGDGPLQDVGRGRPDVAALAGGGTYYIVPDEDLGFASSDPHTSGGTSASAPLWASLMTQIGTIFANQGLPRPGYANDLLYQAAAIAPGAFNDVVLGNNTSSFHFGGDGSVQSVDRNGVRTVVTPTGFGYEAGPGYDLATGLGSPNGLLLARAMTAIAHAQTNALEAPGGATSGLLTANHQASAVDQHIVVQPLRAGPVTITTGDETFTYNASTPSSHAWTNAMAQKALQADFDPELIRLFDEAPQSTPYTLALEQGEAVAVTQDGTALTPHRTALTNDFGFAEYRGSGGGVTLTRPVAVAETALGGDDQEAVVRIRSNAGYANSLDFYRVDDLNGLIDGIAPGEPGYAAAVTARLYKTTAGESTIKAASGQGYMEAVLTGIDHGDLIAARLLNGVGTFWAFAEANEHGADGRPVTHLWNYGLNSWGWEDMLGGGDQDFNDLIFQLDFTSASGSGWLM